MAHFMNSEISTPLNNSLYTEYADVFSFMFRLSILLYTLKLFGFLLLEMCMGITVQCQLLLLLLNSIFALNGCGLCIHIQSHILFRHCTLKLLGFSFFLKCMDKMVSTTFAPAENSTFALNGCGLCMFLNER